MIGYLRFWCPESRYRSEMLRALLQREITAPNMEPQHVPLTNSTILLKGMCAGSADCWVALAGELLPQVVKINPRTVRTPHLQ